MATGFACIHAKMGQRDKDYALPAAGTVDGRVGAQFFKMKLIYTATVALRNCNDIVADLDLFTLFGQVTEQVRHITADRYSRPRSPNLVSRARSTRKGPARRPQ